VQNKHGLSRNIPTDVKATIRREAGFGCVICGLVYAQYEHIDPEWHDAEKHDPDRMTLLCGACHERVTRGLWSKEKVWNAKENPVTFRNGECRESLDLASPLVIRLGSTTFEGFGTIIRTPTWRFDLYTPPGNAGPPVLSFPIQDSITGQEVMRIEGNDLIGYVPGCFDIRTSGPKISLLDAHGRVLLGMRAKPPRELHIEDLYLHVAGGYRVEASDGGPLEFVTPKGERSGFHHIGLQTKGPPLTAVALGGLKLGVGIYYAHPGDSDGVVASDLNILPLVAPLIHPAVLALRRAGRRP
jgi:hypothetical protein